MSWTALTPIFRFSGADSDLHRGSRCQLKFLGSEYYCQTTFRGTIHALPALPHPRYVEYSQANCPHSLHGLIFSKSSISVSLGYL
ncbi:hypothetical protein BKA82DRAFT_1008844 [Pisolithus tinctorius]|uniref:Uncharacterized protein n=1 Tax=Pisolithus tinctorius Marx 270 TaxID=870435 RepID=A0A0C3MXG6_PISTI|nr:hypothetical protein BKA82DRAFT_1008844 [Pisolithus tinctorius]KIN93599.1 hypothetical protein M404DRAFT_1008844 [Pisolithus tinctorius Marx 270]